MTAKRILPLSKLHAAASATLSECLGWEIPYDYGNFELEFQDIRSLAAVIDFSYMTMIRVTGADRADYLNRRLSQKIIDMDHGEARRATLLDATGKMLADLEVYAWDNSFLLMAPPCESDELMTELSKYLFTEDCKFDDITHQRTCVGVLGPKLPDLMAANNIDPLPEGKSMALRPLDNVDDVRLVSSRYIPGGLLLLGNAEETHHLMGCVIQAVEGVGGHLAGFRAFDAHRIEIGVPWWGRDFDHETIPLEADLYSAIDFNKGCYPGQETIAKINNLGHPARKLIRIVSDNKERLPENGVLKDAEGKEAGVVTSSAVLPGGRSVGLAMVKWSYREEGVQLRTEAGVDVTVAGANACAGEVSAT